MKLLNLRDGLTVCLTRTSRNQISCSCTRQSADELLTRFPPSGDGSYNVNPATFAQHPIDKILTLNVFVLLTLKVCERLINFGKVVFGYGYQNEPVVLGFV